MDDALAFLPPEWAAWLRLVAELSFALSLVAAAVKPLLGDPSPDDPRWKRVAFALVHCVDWAAANSEPIRAKRARVESQS